MTKTWTVDTYADDMIEAATKNDVWICEINGIQVTMASGKRVWAKEGHAKRALRNHMSYPLSLVDKARRESVWESFLQRRVYFRRL